MSTTSHTEPQSACREASGESCSTGRLLVGVSVLLTILPVLVLAIFIVQLAVDLPFWDQWALTFRIDALFDGRLSMGTLMAPHHEHLMPVPLALTFVLARLTHWNLAMEPGVNFLIGFAIFAVVAVHFWRVQARLGRRSAAVCLPVLSLLVFSITQHANWLWGLQISALLAILCALAAFACLCGPKLGWTRLGAALVLGLCASLSQAHGVLVWPVGLVALLLAHRRARGAIGLWLAMGASIGAYVYSGFSTQEDALSFLRVPSALVQYCLTYLGSPIVHGSQEWALTAGAAGVLMALYLLRRLRSLQSTAFFVALLLFSLGAALITGIGRLDYGLDQALASRYISFATPFWVALVSLLGLDLPKRREQPLRRLASLATLVGLWFLVAVNGFQALPTARSNSESLRTARQQIWAARDSIPTDPTLFANLLADPSLHELLKGLEVGDEQQFQLESQAEIEALLDKYGLNFMPTGELAQLNPSTLLVRYGLVVLKHHKLSVFRAE